MQNAPSQKPTPPYWLGLLCLIPLVGAFVGVGLLLYGIIKYKDKWLIIIGSLGIVFTIAVYSFLFYSMKHAEWSKKGFARISQIQLNNLVKNVEYFKLLHNRYPDNLRELLIDDNSAPIEDAIQSVQERKDHYYIYEKIGDKYILFSAGQDGIPNTKDDLFPQITINDSSKIALIIK